MPEMPVLESREVAVAEATIGEACTTSSSTSTTPDAASVVSPCAGMEDTRKRVLNTFIRSVKDTAMIEKACTYAKDVNDRSPLVQVVSKRVQPLLERAAPIVVSVVERIDDSIDATAVRLADESAEVISEIYMKGDQMRSAIATTVASTKADIFGRASAVVVASKEVAGELMKCKENMMSEVIRRKNSLVDDLVKLQERPQVQVLVQSPIVQSSVKAVQNVHSIVQNNLVALNQTLCVMVTRIYAQRDLLVVYIQSISLNQLPSSFNFSQFTSQFNSLNFSSLNFSQFNFSQISSQLSFSQLQSYLSNSVNQISNQLSSQFNNLSFAQLSELRQQFNQQFNQQVNQVKSTAQSRFNFLLAQAAEARVQMKTQMNTVWLDMMSNDSVLKVQRQFIEALENARTTVSNSRLLAVQKSEQLIAHIVKSAVELMQTIPEEKRLQAEAVCMNICSTFREKIGDEKTDQMMAYIVDSSVAGWLKASIAS